MNLLALESSSPVLSVALQKNDEPISELHLDGFMSHVENLIPLIDRLLQEKNLKLDQIDEFLIGRGPGSFTGLRVAFATLKAFQVIQPKPCQGAMSLDMIVEPLDLPQGTKLTVAVDAHRNKIYLRAYEKRSEGWSPLNQAETADPLTAAKQISPGSFITGDALLKYHTIFEPVLKENRLTALSRETWYPRASSLLSLRKRNAAGLQLLTQPIDFIPLYFRLSEAEERKTHESAC